MALASLRHVRRAPVSLNDQEIYPVGNTGLSLLESGDAGTQEGAGWLWLAEFEGKLRNRCMAGARSAQHGSVSSCAGSGKPRTNSVEYP